MELEIPGSDEGPKGRGILEMRRAGWCLGVSPRAGAAAHVLNACTMFWYAPEGVSTGSKYSDACEVFQRAEVLGSMHDFPSFEVLGSAQDFRCSEELESVRDFLKVTKSWALLFLPGSNSDPLRHCQVNKSCPVLNLPGRKLVTRGHMALKGLATQNFQR